MTPPPHGPVLWCGLNPSTAGAWVNDLTTEKIGEFTRRSPWGRRGGRQERGADEEHDVVFGVYRYLLWRPGFELVNLFAKRATNPTELRTHAFPVGARNDEVIRAALSRAVALVVAWGHDGEHHLARVAQVVELLEAKPRGLPLLCLGTTKDGHPCHPSRLPYATELRPWVLREDLSARLQAAAAA